MNTEEYYKKYFGVHDIPDKLNSKLAYYSYQDLIDFAEQYNDKKQQELLITVESILDDARKVNFNVKEICINGISLKIKG